MDGSKGFDIFIRRITDVVNENIDQQPTLDDEGKLHWKEEFGKPQGWIVSIAVDMKHQIWETLVNNLGPTDILELGVPGMMEYKRDMLESWSKDLVLARGESNVKYTNKVVQVGGGVNILSGKKGVRPSRVVPDVRSIHFLRPDQIEIRKYLGKGKFGKVYTCNILDHPLIPPNLTLVAKKFIKGNNNKKREDAMQEVLMGGLNHQGIVGAMAMSIDDPPRLVYDYYNGGDLKTFIDKCEKWHKRAGKSKDDGSMDFRFISKQKIFLENRLGICMALLETMQFLHAQDRVHCDLHDSNILLHFDYESERAVRVYVGLCDFGLSKPVSQCQLPEQRIWVTPRDAVDAYRKEHPQMAPELVCERPAFYSKSTDVYSVGNTFETLLQVKDNWDGMTRARRCLAIGWKPMDDSRRLDHMISTMMDRDPSKRLDCGHWVRYMHVAFPDCHLRMHNSPFLRD